MSALIDTTSPAVAARVLAAPDRTRVADVIVETLKELGVDTFYGIPGGAICPIYDALVDHPELRVIPAHRGSRQRGRR